MNCKQCSKIIPDGFADCPWCGAAFTEPRIGNAASAIVESSPAHRLILAISIASSAILFTIVSYVATNRSNGPISLENSGYFLGHGAGAIVLAALAVFGYSKFRGEKLRGPVQALVILTVSSVLTMLTLLLPAQPRISGIDQTTVRRYTDESYAEKAPNSHPPNCTKWDAAARSLMKDIVARNQRYVSEISALDETAKPLYTPESFRDTTSIQQMIEQLNARLAVADKYTDWQPMFANMKGYVAAVDASAEEKQKFLRDFEASLPKTLAVCQAISAKEHAWLQASLDLYQFALAKSGTYVWQQDNLSFKNRVDSRLFEQKFVKARKLNADFLQAYWQVRQAEQAMMAQLGLQGQETDSPQER
jgi:hypothetical protein